MKHDINRFQSLRLFLILGLFINTFSVLSQHEFFKNYSIREGLPSSYIYSVIEDHNGYVWFSSDVGVTRFDGYDFTSFNIENGLSSSEILQMYEDTEQRLWFLGYNGKISFYQNGTFFNEKNNQLIKEINSHPEIEKTNSFPVSIAENNGDIYICYKKNSILRIDKSGSFQIILFDKDTYSMWFHKNELWVLSSDGVLTLKNDKFVHASHHVFNRNFGRVYPDDEHLIYSHGKDIYKFSYATQSIVDSLKVENVVTFISKNKIGNYIVCTRSGYFEISPDFNKRISSNIKNEIVSSFMNDSEGNTWLTTLGAGVFFSSSSQVTYLGLEEGLPSSGVYTLYSDGRGSLWCGLRNEVARIEQGSLRNYSLKSSLNETIKQIKPGRTNELLFISKSGIYSLKNEELKQFPFRASDAFINGNYLYAAGQGFSRIPVQVYTDLLRDPGKDEVFYNFNEYRINDVRVNCVVPWKENYYLIGSAQGVYEFNTSTNEFIKSVNFQHNEEITSIAYDSKLRLVVIGSKTNGLYCYLNDKKIQHFNSDTGLSSNNITSISVFNNKIWIGTSMGISYVQIENGKPTDCILFHSKIGLPKFKISSVYPTNTKVFLATDNGIIITPLPENVDRNRVAPRIIIEDIFINTVRLDNLKDTRLEYFQNGIKFSFVGISYQDYGKLTYHYKLKGSFSDWRTTNSRSVNFDALAPGKYTFEIFATNDRGYQSEKLFRSFEILPPFYKTIWFVGICVIIVIVLIVMIWRFRVNRINKKFEMEKILFTKESEKLELEKNLLLTEQKIGVLQMNPHFIFNSLNMIKGLYAEKNVEDGNYYISKFSKLLREIIECNSLTISLKKELEILELYLVLIQKRYNNKFKFQINNQIEHPERVGIPPMLIQPFIENAIIHGFSQKIDGNLSIEISKTSELLVVTIIDDGIGFFNSVQTNTKIGTSHGVKITQERLQLLQELFKKECSLNVHSELGEPGTTIRIVIPLIDYERNNN